MFGYHFFFQAEDGIRDYKVTGVQTCALPILFVEHGGHGGSDAAPLAKMLYESKFRDKVTGARLDLSNPEKIGRASCRERVEITVLSVSLNKMIEKVIKIS